MNEEMIEKIKGLIARCGACEFATCENCEINWTEVQAIRNLLNSYISEKDKNNKAIEYIKTHKYREGYSHRDLNNNGKLVFEMIETTLVSRKDLLEILEESK